jgi:hypothetical protein
MEIDIKAAYQSYLQIYESEKFEVLYDVDERPMMIRERKLFPPPLTWMEWLIAEMEIGIENEAYEYCAVIRDELNSLQNETDSPKTKKNENKKPRKNKGMDSTR